MDGLAISAVVLLALLLPGFVVYYSYCQSTGSWDVSGTTQIFLTRAVIWSIIFSPWFHAVWGEVFSYFGNPVQYDALMSLLFNSYQDEHWFRNDFYSQSFLWWSAIYLLTQCVAASFVGWFGSHAMRKMGWPERTTLRQSGGIWHELFNIGEEYDRPDFVVPTFAVSDSISRILYRGILIDYQLDAAGNLHRVVLEGAYRRVDLPTEGVSKPSSQLTQDHEDSESSDQQNVGSGDHSGSAEDGGWSPMPGERFVLNCDNVATIDVDYVWWKDRAVTGEHPIVEEQP